MSSENIFLDDWYACLQAHLAYVVEKNDRTNEVSLIEVLKRIGVSEQNIEQVRTQTLAALGREAELLQDAEVAQDTAPDLAAIQEINDPLEITEDVTIEPTANSEETALAPERAGESLDQAQPPDPPVETRRPPDPPPKLSQMSLF